MDYCSSCRRHLNGALVCPGCGAYAPDIAPATADGRVVPARATMAAPGASAGWEVTASGTWHDGRLRDEAPFGAGTGEAGMGEAAESAPYGDVKDAPPAPQGRAARRRQLARWKKNQRRAVVATAVALVGGGLTVATMDRTSPTRAQAATAPETASMGSTDDQVVQPSDPTSTRPDTHRSSHTPPTQAPATNSPAQQSAAAPQPTTQPSTRPYAAAAPRTTAPSAQQPLPAASPTATLPAHAGTAAQQTSPPAATNGSSTGTQQATPAPAATSPSQICLLVVCLG